MRFIYINYKHRMYDAQKTDYLISNWGGNCLRWHSRRNR
ncbi:hypothetical protein VIBNIMADA3020_500033 [Vibrio nigripulchritudo MADA3020]|nr:hypothetical protein VIBNIMADA3020_500033 [Vibrio nigripulchritudo MADA3020]